MFNIFKNFLEQKTLQNIKKEIKQMHWFYSDYTSEETDKSNFLFYHLIFENNKVLSDKYFNTILMPVLGKLNFKYLHRAKLNLYTKQDKQIKTSYHIDCNMEHTVALFSLNTNNGYTEFASGEKIESVENRLVIFDGNIEHSGTTHTDAKTRAVINFNYYTWLTAE